MVTLTGGALAWDAFLLGSFALLLVAIRSAWTGSRVPKGSYRLGLSKTEPPGFVDLCFLLVVLLGLRLPPGPPGKPIMGNAGDMPNEQEWETFSKWAKIYGVFHINMSGRHF